MRPRDICRRALCGLITLLAVGPEARALAADPAVLYELRDGDTLSAIAARFHVPAKKILALNDIRNPNRLHGAGLLLPAGATTSTLAPYVAWPAAGNVQPCVSTRWSSLRPAGDHNYFDRVCTSGPDGKRACFQESAVTVTTRDGAATRIELPRSPVDLRDEVADVDIDGDGRPETLISSHSGTSNGIGHVFRTLVVLRYGRPLLRYDSGEFTANTAAILRDGRCHLASSHWEHVKHPLLGSAEYLVERRFDPVGFRMDDEIVGTRYSDYGKRKRLRIPFDPLAVSPHRAAVTGTIVSASNPLASVVLKTDNGVVSLSFPAPEGEAPARIGDARTGRVYPLGFDVPLVGRKVEVRSYGTFDQPILWLAPI